MFQSKFIFYYFVLTLLISCDFLKSNDISDTAINKTITFNINNVSESINLGDIKNEILFTDIPKTVPYSKEKNKKYADLILIDSIVVMHSFKPHYIPIDKINWEALL